nr:hypothetical protein GCM10025699_34080 [Microbacterium flavescens]
MRERHRDLYFRRRRQSARSRTRGPPLHAEAAHRARRARRRRRWRGCDRPASYCEAHHIDPYATGGRTDVDRGILLCRFHHMELHHGGWRITRDGRADFVLHPPPGRGDPVILPPRLTLRRLWADLDPPPPRFRPAA